MYFFLTLLLVVSGIDRIDLAAGRLDFRLTPYIALASLFLIYFFLRFVFLRFLIDLCFLYVLRFLIDLRVFLNLYFLFVLFLSLPPFIFLFVACDKLPVIGSITNNIGSFGLL